jgi:hypothetical protein
MILYVPIFIEMPFLFGMWLKTVPEYTILFCRIIFLKNLIEQLFIPLASAVSAKGDIKSFQLLNFILYLFPLPISYLFFKFEFPPYLIYVIFTIVSIISAVNILLFCKIKCQLNILEFFSAVIFRCSISLLIILLISTIPYLLFEEGIIRLIIVVITSLVSFLSVIFLIGFTQFEKLKIIQFLKDLLVSINQYLRLNNLNDKIIN